MLEGRAGVEEAGTDGWHVVVENDATAALVAETRWGAARGARDVVLLTIGTGVGGGLLVGGEVVRGASGAAGELGHVVIEADGPPCPGNCPNRGCLEALCSGTALERDATELGEDRPDTAIGRIHAECGGVKGHDAVALAREGD